MGTPIYMKSLAFQIGNNGTGEKNLKLFTLPANLIDTNNSYMEITATGEFATNSNSKTIKFYFGTTLILTSGALTTNGGTWTLNATITRTNATNQTAEATITVNGVTSTVTSSSPTQNLANEVILKCTGEGTANNDVVQKTLIIKYFKD
ncbi:MAG: hypothetical protein ACT4ON_08085 [Bacteroidota bacterium]